MKRFAQMLPQSLKAIGGFCLAMVLAGPSPWALAQQPFGGGVQVVALEVSPKEVSLANPYAYSQLLVTARLADGSQIDATRHVTFEVTGGNVAAVSNSGFCTPLADGSGAIRVTLDQANAEIPLAVSNQTTPHDVSFVRDVMPTMSKMGCNMGTCHGAANGKNGFKLSLRGYDPYFDYSALTDDLGGRRFNRAAPDLSLMLLKATGSVPHVGGVRTRTDERYYKLLREWVSLGVKFDPDSSRVVSIEIEPKDAVIPLPEMQQQMRVIATFSDGTSRDVSAEAFIESSNTEVAEVTPQGVVTAIRRGEAAMLARYEGAYTATNLIVMGDRTGFTWQPLVQNNYVDELIDAKLQQVRTQPSQLCSDEEFLRRIFLDLTGLPPAPEVVDAFLADTRETRVKRDELVDQLVGNPEYIEYTTNKWSDLLQVNRKFLGEEGAWSFRSWIQQAVASNMPYDQFVHTILTSRGSTLDNPPAAYYKILRDPDALAENTTQLFLGIRFSCNKCHDHPFERWTQDQYYQMTAFFAQVGRKPAPAFRDRQIGGSAVDSSQSLVEIVYDTGSGDVTHVRTGKQTAPKFPYLHEDQPLESSNRREQLAHWLTSPKNPYFAKSVVNRQWSYLFGQGLIEPADDIRAGNPPSNSPLLARMTEEFIASGFDMQQLTRTICKSRTYQASIVPNAWNEDDKVNFSHASARRLPAETLYDSIHFVLGSVEKLPGVPVGFRSVETPDAEIKPTDGFLDLFGRPPRESSCECERGGGVMLGQALNLVNGPTLAEALADPQNRINKLVAEEADDARLVEKLFLAVLSRKPTAAEIATGVEAIRTGEDRLQGSQDLAWVLINSPAFLFNH